VKLQLKRSATLVSGNAKPPLASQLDFGEIAINYNTVDPKLFFKDSAGNVLGITDNYLQLRGGTLTGDLLLNGDPTSSLMPATKQYTDNAITALSNSIVYPVTSVNGFTGSVNLNHSNVGAPSVTGTSATGTWGISITGNSATATTLATARSISLSGDVSGSASFNGSSNISIAATVADDSHNHIISNIDGLQTALNAKQDASTAISNSLALNGKADTSFVQTANNSSLNGDTRNTRGVTRLYRRDGNSDYSVQTYWTGTRWLLRGYNSDTFHAECQVSYADSAGSAATATTATNAGNASTLTGYGWTSSGKDVRATEFYADNWFRNYNDSEGLYNEATGVHWHSDGNGYWCARDSSNHMGIKFKTNGSTIRGYVYADNGNNIGFLNNSGSWSLKMDSGGNAVATGDVTAFSDRSMKTDIQPIREALNKVDQINGVTFERVDIDHGVRHAGVIAQDVQKVLPEVVREDENGKLTVAYGNIVGLLVEAIKELRQEVKELKGE
jgi:hypothetical protein